MESTGHFKPTRKTHDFSSANGFFLSSKCPVATHLIEIHTHVAAATDAGCCADFYFYFW